MTPTAAICFNLATLVTQSRFVWEHLSLESWAIAEPSQEAQQRWLRWCQVVANGDCQQFQQRLQHDGLDPEQVERSLRSITVEQPLPAWIVTLQQIVEAAIASVGQSITAQNDLPIDPKAPLPFEEVLLPAVLVARQQVSALAGTAMNLLSDAAYRSLERALLQRLTQLCAKTLEAEFTRDRPLGQRLLSQLIRPTAPSTAHYTAFVQTLLTDGLRSLFQKYPVLSRLVATVVDFWVEATVEFLQRLQTDLPQIEQTFQPDRAGRVIAIQADLSDPHHRGRSVLSLTFASGFKLIYKPKNLGLEATYNQFLHWCNQQLLPLELRVLKVIDRGTYGWMEYVEHQGCVDQTAAQRFYQRAGMLLGLLYGLRGTDCHAGNLIASGEHLVLVDLEALMQPEAPLLNRATEGGIEAISGAIAQPSLRDSVLRTGLLPRWQISGDRRVAFDISGLGSVAHQPAPRPVARWRDINTDEMRLEFAQELLPLQANVPLLNGVPLCPNDYLNELEWGFQQIYEFLIQHQKAILTHSPFVQFAAQPIRFVFRNTDLYHVVLHKTLTPQFLQNGLDFSIELDILSRALLTSDAKPAVWSILRSECQALTQLDIPYFGTIPNHRSLHTNTQILVEDYFPQASYDQAIAHFQRLNATDLAQQIAILRGAFHARIAHSAQPTAVRPVVQPQVLTTDELLQQAEAIAQAIGQQALRYPDGSVSWLGLEYIPKVKRLQLQLLGDSLYDGRCGIALFLAACHRITGAAQWRELALAALQPLRQLRTVSIAAQQAWATQLGIGGATGLGSILYSFVKIGQLLQAPELIAEARQLTALITPEVIAADRRFDVVGGAAGAILGLLAVYRETSDDAVLATAIAAGHHLLNHRVSFNGLPRAWKTIESQPLTGFSHGAAGIASALLQLYQLTQTAAFLTAATEAIAYEQQFFVPGVANWLDLRTTTETGHPNFRMSWCHGAPGIGLARLSSFGILNDACIQSDIETAIQTTLQQDSCDLDSLCCGSFGQIALLTIAAQTLARPELLTAARRQASRAIARAKELGNYQLFLKTPHNLNPSFFQGTAGIGYQLLRLSRPETLPEVLLWQ